MGHAEKIIAELATLDEAESAKLLEYVQQLKAQRPAAEAAEADAAKRERLIVGLRKYRLRMPADYRFDRDEANAR